jgi:hypothetical protein
VVVDRAAQQTEIETAARASVAKWIEHGTIIKTIYVPQKLMNFVVQA